VESPGDGGDSPELQPIETGESAPALPAQAEYPADGHDGEANNAQRPVYAAQAAPLVQQQARAESAPGRGPVHAAAGRVGAVVAHWVERV
jgi:hypothetical protein